jgi:periplasmic protein TonB
MEFTALVHLILKHTHMTNNDIMRRDILDIVFENRNKSYGAYTLRKEYDKRMLTALGAGMSVVLLFVFISQFGGNKAAAVPVVKENKEMVVREVKMPREQPKQLEKPKEVAKPKAAPAPKVAQAKYTTPVVKPDDKVKENVKPVTDLGDKQIADNNSDGKKDDGTVKPPEKPVVTDGGGIGAGPSEPVQPDFVVQERGPEFPGGDEGLKKFLSSYLSTPGGLDVGEKKVVRIKFKVEKDGSVHTFEIVTSGGNEFDTEVVRVLRKMPRWIPAIQNGVNVPVSYIVPVTFMGVEE